MTNPARAGGKTAKGFRYPGNDITVDAIPGAIENLARDVDGSLGAYGAYQIQQIAAGVQMTFPEPTKVVFDQLKAVAGVVGSWGQDGFGPGLVISIMANSNIVRVSGVLTAGLSVGTPTAAPNPPGQSNFRLTGTQYYSPQYVQDGRWVVVNLIAWGPKA